MTPLPAARDSSQAVMLRLASGTGWPLNWAELTGRPLRSPCKAGLRAWPGAWPLRCAQGDPRARGPLYLRTSDDPHDRQVELLRELEVALVVARHGHDGAGPVFH